MDRPAAAFIFDLDGTLVDSGADLAASANFTRRWFGLPELPAAAIVPMIGDGARLLVARALGHPGGGPGPGEAAGDRLEEGLALFRDHYDRHCLDATVPYPGVREALARLGGRPLMVATNKPRRFTLKILEALGLSPAFRRVVTAEDAGARKPDPRVLLACLEGLAVRPAEVVVVGDHPNDVLAARAIGAVAVGLTSGLGDPAAVRASGPDLLIGSLAELPDLFPETP